jgi:hypothetical protein
MRACDLRDSAACGAAANSETLLPLDVRVLDTLPHLSDSDFMKAAASAWVLPIGRAPCAASFFCIPGDFTIFTRSSLILAASAGGSPAGAITSYQSSAS